MTSPQPFQTLPSIGDGTYLGAAYQAGVLKLQVDHWDLGPVEVLVPTVALLLAPSVDLPCDHVARKGTRLEIRRVVDHVAGDQGHFVPPHHFGQLMNDTQAGHHLCYGLKVDPALHIVSLLGYTRWVTCLCTDLNTITWWVLPD
ncbi:hypothetical protein GCM10008955_10070 [Deinococcus malanensis]|uniref:Uncharacterized protein n=1 Tax=Deinococcus malanensis TaxID=1706855 RepID=A0ABQ2EP17_9DEIO|nr:hypothetical protein [Deinococcus malanensis]GGK18635.1 hypothetical protein GCM10008955_10070 [Deinococcus malanensis]